MTAPEPLDDPASALAHPVVALDEVSVRFPRRSDPVLHNVSLALEQGEQVILLGASGSGKSTVLHLVSGVVPHSVDATVTGTVSVGTCTAESSVVQRSRHLGVLAQDPSSAVCLPTVQQEVGFPLENHAVSPGSIGPRVELALDTVGATTLRGRSTATLSGGESQRVALAAALVAEPDVLLLDEATSMLDPAGIRSVRHALDDALDRYRPAMVLVEHRLDEWSGAAGLAGLPPRALALDETGRVLAEGPTGSVLREHAHTLQAAGCWLPLDAELLAITGAKGGLAAAANRALVSRLAAGDGPEKTPDDHRGSAPVLAARSVAVTRHTAPAGRRRGSPTAGGPVRPLLSGVDLDLRAGDIVAVVGANGVGKTTLLLTLAGLMEPAAGTVHGARPGVVFQNPEHQFLAQTVRGEIGHGLPTHLAGQVVARQLRRHRLEHLADQNPFRLSGGEKRRLSLAAMLAHDRHALLADEPTLGLDRRDALATVTTLRDVAAEGGAVLFASHDLRLVAALADRVLVLGEGGIVATGPTVAVLRDHTVLSKAGLRVPTLVGWLLEQLPDDAVRRVLRGLDEAMEGSTSGDRP